MRSFATACLVFSCIGIVALTSNCWGQAGSGAAQRMSWDRDSIARFRDAVSTQLESLGAFAALESPSGTSAEENQTRKIRASALKALSSIRPSANAADIAKKNLSLYWQYPAFEGRYELTDWPGADALAKMGSLAYPAVYSRLGDPCSELDIALIVHIVLNVDGRELGIQRLKIKVREIDVDGQIPLRKNLQRVLTILENDKLPRETYSPALIYRAGKTNPRLLEPTDE